MPDPRDIQPAKRRGLRKEAPQLQVCQNSEHNPPLHIAIPAGYVYDHVCPGCGNTITIRSQQPTFGVME